MQVERIDRWVWVVLSLAVGACLAWARSNDQGDLQTRIGHGVAEQSWFERELVRRVPAADGSFVRGFDRLTVFPSSVVEGGRRRPVHLVAGMALARVHDARADGATGATGTLRPCFFVAPVPFTPLSSRGGNNPATADRTVTQYLDGLASSGVSYRYAWWADSRYRAAAWVGGSFVLVGLLWPTAINLLAYGSFRRPPRERGASLWRVRRPRTQATQRPSYAADRPPHEPADSTATPGPATDSAVILGSPAAPAALPLSQIEPDDTAAHTQKDPKQFGASDEDFYPTELKPGHPRAV